MEILSGLGHSHSGDNQLRLIPGRIRSIISHEWTCLCEIKINERFSFNGLLLLAPTSNPRPRPHMFYYLAYPNHKSLTITFGVAQVLGGLLLR